MFILTVQESNVNYLLPDTSFFWQSVFSFQRSCRFLKIQTGFQPNIMPLQSSRLLLYGMIPNTIESNPYPIKAGNTSTYPPSQNSRPWNKSTITSNEAIIYRLCKIVFVIAPVVAVLCGWFSNPYGQVRQSYLARRAGKLYSNFP